jgi:hypothetical protein
MNYNWMGFSSWIKAYRYNLLILGYILYLDIYITSTTFLGRLKLLILMLLGHALNQISQANIAL